MSYQVNASFLVHFATYFAGKHLNRCSLKKIELDIQYIRPHYNVYFLFNEVRMIMLFFAPGYFTTIKGEKL